MKNEQSRWPEQFTWAPEESEKHQLYTQNQHAAMNERDALQAENKQP
jgi:hypothetical protein